MKQVNFMNADLSKADISEARGEAVCFIGARLEGVKAQKANLRCSNFENARLGGSDFTRTRLDRSIFTRANCEKARFAGARIPYADFSHAVLRNADFSEADMTQCVLHRVDDQDAVWKNANRTNIKTTDPDLKEAEDWAPPPFEIPTKRT